jgi:hypothetical protein
MRRMRHVIVVVLAVSVLLPTVRAQESSGHLNPVVAKLAAGKTVYGLINTGDMSLANARYIARAPVDFVYADMEHSPLDFPGLAIFLAALTDKAAILAKKSLQPNVAFMARFPPEADQSQWVVKQALDIGLMGVIFNGVDTKDQATIAVRSMRYPPMRGSPRREPVGTRGVSTAAASYAWALVRCSSVPAPICRARWAFPSAHQRSRPDFRKCWEPARPTRWRARSPPATPATSFVA